MKSLFAAYLHNRGAMTCLARTYVGIPRESYSFRLVLALHSSETMQSLAELMSSYEHVLSGRGSSEIHGSFSPLEMIQPGDLTALRHFTQIFSRLFRGNVIHSARWNLTRSCGNLGLCPPICRRRDSLACRCRSIQRHM